MSADNLFAFELDPFQVRAIRAIEEGRNVIVCAPTGAGKTAVAEYCLHRELSRGHRTFYTTPLKALSNQKFHDFRQTFGEARVGLLTGDLSIHRDAPLVVMTTEVFRNMLYGTSLGDVRRNLCGVRSVILDECHYMNDVERGTVWEESIIYAPRDLQLVALSATVANAEELCRWMTAVHAETALIRSDDRPVPLRQHYYFRGELYRLLAPEGALAPRLKRVAGRASGHGRGRRGREPVPAPEEVVEMLAYRGMLPAIYFIFSRKGCEEALRRSHRAVELSRGEAERLQAQVEEFLREHPSLAGHPHLHYLWGGIAAHHAGLLPGWRALVERLFQRGLIKVVFATETLAAGINMPARSTVIHSISKFTGEGRRLLTPSEFLQMSGRAGRRGRDSLGHVVVLHHPMERLEDVVRLARAPADPLTSRFTPSYGMVLNLLQRHTVARARELVERSFGQFLAEQDRQRGMGEKERLEERIARLSQPLCPGEIGDLNRYQKLRQRVRSLSRQIEAVEKGTQNHRQHHGVRRAVGELRRRRRETRREWTAMPCHHCPEQNPCRRQQAERRRLTRRLESLRRRAPGHAPTAGSYWLQFQRLADLLREAGYLQGRRPTERGRMAASLRGTNVLFLAEVASGGFLERLRPEQVAAVVAALVSEERRSPRPPRGPSPEVQEALCRAGEVARRVQALQRRFGVEVAVDLNPVFSGAAEQWAAGASWAEVREAAGAEEGDLVRALRRTLDMLRQWARAPGVSQALAALCREAEQRMERDELREAQLLE